MEKVFSFLSFFNEFDYDHNGWNVDSKSKISLIIEKHLRYRLNIKYENNSVFVL